jgi:hypothetical protein
MSRSNDRGRCLVYVGLALASSCAESAGDPRDGIDTNRRSPSPANHVSGLDRLADPNAPAPTLRSAWETSCERGRPLLVVLASVDRRTNTLLALFSALLCHGSAEELSALAPFELACASAEEVAELSGAPVDRAARAILLRRRAGVVHAETFAPQLPELVIQPRTIETIGDAVARDAYDERQRERVAVLAEALRQEASAEVPADASAEPLTSDSPALAKAVRERWSAHPPAGTRWASNDGCGTRIEGGAGAMVECGMACVPETSQRFLVHYVEARTAR